MPPAPYIALTHAHIHTAFCAVQAFKHGEAETMSAQAAAARLRDTLAGMRAAPVLLLVHDEPAARAALHDLGIETSTWASGADALLRSVRAFPRSRLPVCLSDRNHVSVSASIFVSGSGGSVSCWMGDWPPVLTHSRRRTAAVDRHRSGSILALRTSHVALHYTSYSAGLVTHEADRRPPYRDERSYDRRPHDSRAPYRNEDRGNGRRDGYDYDYDYDRGRDRSYVSSSRDERAPARRSRSPHRDRDRTRDRRDDHARERDRARGPSSRSRSRERDGPAGAGADGGVYVVDVRVLFDALTQTARTRRTIGADARDAGVREAGEGEWCAGNESWCVLSTLFLFFFVSLVGGALMRGLWFGAAAIGCWRSCGTRWRRARRSTSSARRGGRMALARGVRPRLVVLVVGPGTRRTMWIRTTWTRTTSSRRARRR